MSAAHSPWYWQVSELRYHVICLLFPLATPCGVFLFFGWLLGGFFILYWGIVDLKCYVVSRCLVAHTHILSFSDSFPHRLLQSADGNSCAVQSVFMGYLFLHSSVHLYYLASHLSPSLFPFGGNRRFVFKACKYISYFYK